MKLLTKVVLAALPAYGATERVALADKVCPVKFFDPQGSWTWYAIEYDPVDRLFWGLVDGHEKEFGAFSLDELESYTGRFGLKIERDIYWTPKRIGDIFPGVFS